MNQVNEASGATMPQKKLLSLVGFAKKAGKLAVGCELTLSAVRSGRRAPKLILLSSDCSENTKKRIQNTCTYYNVPYAFIDATGDALGKIAGKETSVAVVGILDPGFAEAVKKYLPERDEK